MTQTSGSDRDASASTPSGGSLTQARAANLAEHFVSPLGRRWAHVQAVARRAKEVAEAVPEGQRAALLAAAWLHDIGYSPEIGTTRFHPLAR